MTLIADDAAIDRMIERIDLGSAGTRLTRPFLRVDEEFEELNSLDRTVVRGNPSTTRFQAGSATPGRRVLGCESGSHLAEGGQAWERA